MPKGQKRILISREKVEEKERFEEQKTSKEKFFLKKISDEKTIFSHGDRPIFLFPFYSYFLDAFLRALLPLKKLFLQIFDNGFGLIVLS